MREHGGDLARAIEAFGGDAADWIDLSTGINRRPYPAPPISAVALTRLPDADLFAACEAAARRAYGVAEGAEIVAVAGAQAAIQALPQALDVLPQMLAVLPQALNASPRAPKDRRLAVVSPTYNEHAAAFEASGWRVDAVAAPELGASANVMALVNPNNPDGRSWSAASVRGLLGSERVLIVDESFADVAPQRSVADACAHPNLIVLRSLGKFFGLAGLRLGFAICAPERAARLRAEIGPWAVSGPALEIGAAALADEAWATATRARLERDARRLDDAAARVGWRAVGGCGLFQTYDVGDASAVQKALAERGRIWTRRFSYAPGWLRLGAPGDEAEWARLGDALGAA